MVCGVNPRGPEGKTCADFSAIARADTTTRQPIGGDYYLGDWIPQPFPTLTTANQQALLDGHPQFTSRCPNCETLIAQANEGQWKCGYCEWEESESILAG